MKKKYSLPYEEQLARIIRLNEGLQKYSVATDNNHEEAIDAFTSFFIQCYHMADWFEKSGFFEKSIYNFIKNSSYLSLCQAIANTQKHHIIHNHKKQNKNCKFCDLGAFDNFGITTPISQQYNPFNGGKNEFCICATDFAPFPLNILDLSNKCIEEWQRFLDMNTGFPIK